MVRVSFACRIVAWAVGTGVGVEVGVDGAGSVLPWVPPAVLVGVAPGAVGVDAGVGASFVGVGPGVGVSDASVGTGVAGSGGCVRVVVASGFGELAGNGAVSAPGLGAAVGSGVDVTGLGADVAASVEAGTVATTPPWGRGLLPAGQHSRENHQGGPQG